MPHRTTYFFPRQFAERGLDESSKQLLDHEKKKIVTSSIKSEPPLGIESDPAKKYKNDVAEDDVVFSKHSAVSELFAAAGEKLRNKHKHVAGAICDWLTDKKGDCSGHRRLSCEEEEDDDECGLLLPPAVKESAGAGAVDRNFDRQVSLPRLSSGSSYAGSLFSGTATTVDGNFSSDVVKEETSSSTRVSTTKRRQQVEEEEERIGKVAQKSKDSYMLQLTLAKRLTCLASLVTEPVLAPGTETWDAESVSYRLWVTKSFP